MILKQRFVERVLEALNAQGMTKSDLARGMNVSAPSVQQYLNGSRSPGLEVIEAFASALHVDPVALLSDKKITARNLLQEAS